MSKEAMKLALARLQARTDTADLDAIAALNEALAEQEPLPAGWGPGRWKYKVKEQHCKACEMKVLANCGSAHDCPMPTWADHAKKHGVVIDDHGITKGNT